MDTSAKLNQYKYYNIILMLYLTAVLAPIVLVHKIITIFGLTTSVCIFVFPITYSFCDIISEVYGYKTAKQAVWLGIAANLLFTGLISLLVRYPSPASWPHQDAYMLVLSNVFSIAVGALVGTILGSFINIYCITRWKILLRGRLFWLRSIGSSMIGEAVFTLTSVLIVWSGKLPWGQLFTLAFTLFMSKVIYSVVMAGPATLVVNRLKKSEGIESYDAGANYNPFNMETTS